LCRMVANVSVRDAVADANNHGRPQRSEEAMR